MDKWIWTIIYKIAKYGKENEPQTKIKRIKTITKFGKDRDNEEDLPGDELIIKSSKNGPNQTVHKISIMKDGKLQETEEEIPDIKITKKRYFENIPQEKETETEKKPEQKDISYPSYKDKDNIMKSDNKEENVPSSMRNKYKNRIRSDEKEKEPSTSDKPDQKEIKEFKTIEQPEEKPKDKNKT